ncbi:MAG: IS66 family insertion sequence element accessory protein TnpB [Roseovarius sp.]|nr:IS66 family insertion sequence element accessory protein TnpB [Roseovarius sp.]
MMRPSNALPAVYLCREVVDFRKGINGLAVLVEEALQLNPFCEQLFVFCNRRRDKVKILYWERNGFCLWHKRLERDRFKWPRRMTDSEVITLSGQQLNWLLDGYDILRLQPHERLHFRSVL